MLEAFALYTWYEEGEGREFVAAFVTSPTTPDPHGRAHEVMRRMSADGTRGDCFSVEKLDINMSNKELGLKPTIDEIETDDFLDAVYRELLEHGVVQLPLWMNQAWVKHEIKMRYNDSVALTGRRLELVPRTALTRSTDAAESEAYDRDAAAEDAGFVESTDA